MTNDKSALDDEYHQILKAKTNVELDLASITAQHLEHVERITVLEEEKEIILRVNTEMKEKERELNKVSNKTIFVVLNYGKLIIFSFNRTMKTFLYKLE